MSDQTPEPMISVCPCNKCSGNLEFEVSAAGSTIQCPLCGLDTVLFIPEDAAIVQQQPSEPQSVNEPVTPQQSETQQQPPPAQQKKRPGGIITTTGNDVSGYPVERYLGIVRGIVVFSPTGKQDFFGGFKQIVGGYIDSYAELCESARNEAFNRMLRHAMEMGADAIIGMRYETAEFPGEWKGAVEFLAYGTAVKLG